MSTDGSVCSLVLRPTGLFVDCDWKAWGVEDESLSRFSDAQMGISSAGTLGPQDCWQTDRLLL